MKQECPFGKGFIVEDGMCAYVEKLLHKGVDITLPRGFLEMNEQMWIEHDRKLTPREKIRIFTEMHNSVKTLSIPQLDFYVEIAENIEETLWNLGCIAPYLYKYELQGGNGRDINIIYPSCKHNQTWELQI